MKVTSTFVAAQIHKQAYINPSLPCVCVCVCVLKTIEDADS